MIIWWLFPTFYLICLLSPTLITWLDYCQLRGICHIDVETLCGMGLSWYSYIIYGIFAIVTAIVEGKFYNQVVDEFDHLNFDLGFQLDPGIATQLKNWL